MKEINENTVNEVVAKERVERAKIDREALKAKIEATGAKDAIAELTTVGQKIKKLTELGFTKGEISIALGVTAQVIRNAFVVKELKGRVTAEIRTIPEEVFAGKTTAKDMIVAGCEAGYTNKEIALALDKNVTQVQQTVSAYKLAKEKLL